jgi:hypothetical protein
MPIEQAFIDDCPYAPGGMLLDEVLVVDRDKSLVRVRMPTHDDLPITREQRVHPLKHPRHVSGGLMIHMTGMAGFVHAYYVFDLRHADGWIGYGGRIHDARYKSLALPGVPIEIECQTTKVRRGSKRIVARYDLRFYQGSSLVYVGDQTAMWLKIEEGMSLPMGGSEDE